MSERPDRITSLLDHLSDDLTAVRLADAASVRRRGRARSRHQAIGSAVAAVAVLVVVVVGAGLLRADDAHRSAPPATQTPTPSVLPTTGDLPLLTADEMSQVLPGRQLRGAAPGSVTTSRCASPAALADGHGAVAVEQVSATGGPPGGGADDVTVSETVLRPRDGSSTGAVAAGLDSAYRSCLRSDYVRDATRVPGGRVAGATILKATDVGPFVREYAGWSAVGERVVQVSVLMTGTATMAPAQVESLLERAVQKAGGSVPSPSASTPFASLPTLAAITTALGGCCGTVVEAADSTPTGDCLASPLTVSGSPVPTRRIVATGDAGLVVAVTLYRADAGTVGGLLSDSYAACRTAPGHRTGFDQPGTTVGGSRLVSVIGAPSGGGVAQQYAGWAPAGGQVEALVQISFTGNGDLAPQQVEKLLQTAVGTAQG